MLLAKATGDAVLALSSELEYGTALAQVGRLLRLVGGEIVAEPAIIYIIVALVAMGALVFLKQATFTHA